MSSNKGLALGFEFLDIEIIDHKTESGMSNEKWNCDECSLFFLSKDKLAEHKNKHLAALNALKCQYCNKTLSNKSDSKESYAIRKCDTCEYKCTNCPLRFQRYSSLVNHEKTHLQMKKKYHTLKRKSHAIKYESENIANNKITRKRQTEKTVSEQPTNTVKDGNDEETVSLNPKKRKRTASSQIHDEKLVPHDSNDPNKTEKQPVATFNKTPDMKIYGENKQNDVKITSADSANTSLHDSIVNYKPFSCHVCGDNFASGDSLLQHINSHGENVSKGFKCKHCGDAFVDIYKMQYHLAICPLAEDETTMVKNIPIKLHTPFPTGPPRKKGRPKKIKSENSSVSSNYDLTPSLSTRGSMKRRNTDNMPDISLENVFVDSNCGEMENLMVDNIKEDPLGGTDVVSETVNNSPIESYEDVTKVHSCPFPRCGIKFSREKALLCHMRNHSDVFEDSYKCHKCDIPFDDIHSLRIHLNECKDIKEENEDNFSEPDSADEYNASDKPCHIFQRKKGDYKCNICGKVFASQDKLKRCLHNTVGHSEKMTPCRLCGEIYNNEELLKKHFRSAHSLNLPFQCSACHVEFDSKIAEAEHYLTHLDSETFECIICSLMLPTYKDLYFHYKHDHVSNQQSICKMCNKIFPNKSLLLNHICKEEEFRNKCLFCHKSFRSNASLSVHIKRHTNKKIIKCKVCYRPFLDTGDLMKHMLFHASVMANARPFKCCLCFVSYKSKFLLATHIRKSHIGKTVSGLKCPICEENSNDVKMMVSHIIHHSIRISKNDVSNLEIKWMDQLKSKSNESAPLLHLPKRGRPRKLNNTMESGTAKISNVNPEKHFKKYNIRKRNQKINIKSLYSTDSSDSGENEDQKSDNEVSGYINEYFTNNGNLSTMSKQETKSNEGLSLAQRQKSENIKELYVNDKPLNYNRGNTLKMNNKVNKLNGISGKSANISQLRAKKRRLSQIESTQQKSSSKPMSFIKISTSNNQKSSKSQKGLVHGTTTPKLTHKHTIPATSTRRDLEESVGKEQQTVSSDEWDGEVIIKNEELTLSTSPVGDMSEDENCADFVEVKKEKEDIFMDNTSMPHLLKITDEECFIKEKKYYEPSLGLTKYSCTTCLLSFPTQEDLLYHNTLHIL